MDQAHEQAPAQPAAVQLVMRELSLSTHAPAHRAPDRVPMRCYCMLAFALAALPVGRTLPLGFFKNTVTVHCWLGSLQ